MYSSKVTIRLPQKFNPFSCALSFSQGQTVARVPRLENVKKTQELLTRQLIIKPTIFIYLMV